jgi:OmpA-OmpF porin, OOP family
MKNLFLLFILSIFMVPVADLHAQLKNMDRRIGDKVKRKIDQKADRTIDKALDKGEKEIDEEVNETVKGDKKEKKRKQDEEDTAEEYGGEATTASTKNGKLEVNRKSDFVAGDKTLFFETFEKDAAYDFPAAWNTTGSGEVLTINNVPGKWLSIPHNTLTFPENVSMMPENFTVEFDLLIPTENRPPITFGFSESKNPVKEGIRYKKLFYFRIDHAQDYIGSTDRVYSGGENNKPFKAGKAAGKLVHVSMSINNSRIRLYMDGEKFFDLPRAFEPATLRNSFFFKAADITSQKDPFYIANFRIAESDTDARSGIVKDLMEKGTVSTNEIQFNFNSDKLQSSSNETIDQLGTALKESADLRLRIIGHTDNVGKDSYNKELSRKRAEAVKNYLTTNHGIAPTRLETEGKGAESPAVSNDSEEGRAKNRRVEFVKI